MRGIILIAIDDFFFSLVIFVPTDIFS